MKFIFNEKEQNKPIYNKGNTCAALLTSYIKKNNAVFYLISYEKPA